LKYIEKILKKIFEKIVDKNNFI
jgi:hypothetical protein